MPADQTRQQMPLRFWVKCRQRPVDVASLESSRHGTSRRYCGGVRPGDAPRNVSNFQLFTAGDSHRKISGQRSQRNATPPFAVRPPHVEVHQRTAGASRDRQPGWAAARRSGHQPVMGGLRPKPRPTGAAPGRRRARPTEQTHRPASVRGRGRALPGIGDGVGRNVDRRWPTSGNGGVGMPPEASSRRHRKPEVDRRRPTGAAEARSEPRRTRQRNRRRSEGVGRRAERAGWNNHPARKSRVFHAGWNVGMNKAKPARDQFPIEASQVQE